MQGLVTAKAVFHSCLRRLGETSRRIMAAVLPGRQWGGRNDWSSCLTLNTTMTPGGGQGGSQLLGRQKECVCICVCMSQCEPENKKKSTVNEDRGLVFIKNRAKEEITEEETELATWLIYLKVSRGTEG